MNSNPQSIDRRQFTTRCVAASAAIAVLGSHQTDDAKNDFQLKYLLGSSMYGYKTLKEILPEVAKISATAIDLWPKVHGDQREQLDEMGEEKFLALIKQHNVTLGCITQFKLGPFGLQEEMHLAQRLGCATIVTSGKGPKGLQAAVLKTAIGKFVEQMKPHLEIAEATGVTIAIQNHANNLIETPDSLKWLIELAPSQNLAIALVPYHLEQDAQKLADLIKPLGNRIAVFMPGNTEWAA